MKIIKSLIVSSLLLTSGAFADGFGLGVGPFSIQFNASDDDDIRIHRTELDSPICDAISNLKQIEMTVEGSQIVSTKEKKIITERVLLEPYAFGITRDGKPVLRGKVIDEKLIKEVSVKFDEDKFDPDSVASKQNGKGFFSGIFNSDKNKNINIRKISDIQVLRESHFDVPKDYKGLNDDDVQVICQIRTAEQN